MRCATISTRVPASRRGSNSAQPFQNRPNPVLDINRILQYNYCDTRYETGRENPVSARGGRLVTRPGPAHDPAGDGEGGAAGTAQEHQSVVFVADRERGAPAYDAIVARAAGEVFQGASRLSGG